MFSQGLPCVPSCQSVHSIKKWPIAQKASPSGRVGQNAKCCAITNSQKRHSYSSASHGTFICPSNAIRFQAGALAKTLAGSYSGIPYLHHTEYHDTSVLWERAGHSEGFRVTFCSKAFVGFAFFVFEYSEGYLRLWQRIMVYYVRVWAFYAGNVLKKVFGQQAVKTRTTV